MAFIEDAPPSPISLMWIEQVPDGNRLRFTLVDPATMDDPSLQIELYQGDPGGEARRILVNRTNGRLVAKRQTGTNGTTANWQDTGTAAISVARSGSVDIDRPEGSRQAQTDPIWFVVSREKDGSRESFTTPLFPAADLEIDAPVDAAASSRTWQYEAGVPKSVISVPAGPLVTISDDMISWAFTESPPQEIAGSKVVKIDDVMRVRLLGTAEDRASFEVHLDELNPTVRVFNGRGGEPLSFVDAPSSSSSEEGIEGTAPPKGATEYRLDGAVAADVVLKVPRVVIESTAGSEMGSAAVISVSRRITSEDGTVSVFSGVARPLRKGAVVATPGTDRPVSPGVVGSANGGGTTPVSVDYEADSRIKIVEQQNESRRILFVVGPLSALVIGWFVWRWATDSSFAHAIRANRHAKEVRGELYGHDDPMDDHLEDPDHEAD